MTERKKILICGDSFAADWTVKYEGFGWPNLLAKTYDVTNVAQAGCSEYKIYKQLMSQDIEDYDVVIISHTSPNRIYVDHHPIHSEDPLHKDCDLIYTDIKEHAVINPELKSIVDFYESYFNEKYAVFVHNMICEKIDHHTRNHQGTVIHISNIDWDDLYQFPDMVVFSKLRKNHGLMNHYNDRTNFKLFNTINSIITGDKKVDIFTKIVKFFKDRH